MQSNPFSSTRGIVLSTSLESDLEFSNTSTDDDIAAVCTHSLDLKGARMMVMNPSLVGLHIKIRYLFYRRKILLKKTGG